MSDATLRIAFVPSIAFKYPEPTGPPALRVSKSSASMCVASIVSLPAQSRTD